MYGGGSIWVRTHAWWRKGTISSTQ
jgi:hypothetical protein